MKNRKWLRVAIPLLVVLAILVVYQYGYLALEERKALLREEQESKAKTLRKYLAVIAEKPEWEKRLVALKEQRKAESAKLIEGET